MAIVIGNTQRKYISEYIVEDFETSTTRKAFASVNVVGADEVVDPVGLPVIVTTGGVDFELYKEASDIAAAPESGLPDGSKVGVIVGDFAGFGHNTQDVTIPAGGVSMTIMYRDGTVMDNIDFSITQTAGDPFTVEAAPALQAKQDEFKTELEKQRIVVKGIAETVAPAYT